MSSQGTSLTFRENAIEALADDSLREAMRNSTKVFTSKRAASIEARAAGGVSTVPVAGALIGHVATAPGHRVAASSDQ